MTGFNRRFSPHTRRLRELTQNRSNPMILNYQMNAGYIATDHWVHGAEGGGRNIGEACHVYDLFGFLTDSRIVQVTASALRLPQAGYYSPRDNFVATLTYADGSVANLVYTALGSKDYPKERLQIYCEGRVLSLEDYRETTIHGARVKNSKTARAEKGHREELGEFARVVQEGGEWPIPLWQQVQATRVSFAVERHLGLDTK